MDKEKYDNLEIISYQNKAVSGIDKLTIVDSGDPSVTNVHQNPSKTEVAVADTFTLKRGLFSPLSEEDTTIVRAYNDDYLLTASGKLVSKEEVGKIINNSDVVDKFSTSKESVEEIGNKNRETAEMARTKSSQPPTSKPDQTPESEKPKSPSESNPTGTEPDQAPIVDSNPKSQEDINNAAVGENEIKKGDTLWKYATQTGHSITALALANGIEDPNLIFAGDTIDFEIDKSQVVVARGNVTNFINSLEGAVKDFSDGVNVFGEALVAETSGESLSNQIDEIQNETKTNISQLNDDATKYQDWLDRLVQALEYEEQNTNDIWGNTELLETKDI